VTKEQDNNAYGMHMHKQLPIVILYSSLFTITVVRYNINNLTN